MRGEERPSCDQHVQKFNSYITMAKGVTKKGKDPNAPKRAMSAFFIYMQENRAKLKKPGMSVADVAKAAGLEWGKAGHILYQFKDRRNLQIDKSQYEKKAEADKQRYERELAAYKGTN